MEVAITIFFLSCIFLVVLYVICEYYNVRIDDCEDIITRKDRKIMMMHHNICRYRKKLKDLGVDPNIIELEYEIDRITGSPEDKVTLKQQLL